MKNTFIKISFSIANLYKRFSILEKLFSLLIFISFTVLFSNFQLITASSHHVDAAFLMEVLTAIKETGSPTTYLGPAFLDAFNTFFLNAEALCKADLLPTGRGLSVLGSHAYYIIYPLTALTWIFSPSAVIAVTNGFGFSVIIFITYWIIRRQGASILAAISFCLLVMAHPAWSHASLGDFYADRFFMPLALLYVSLLYDAMTRKNSSSWIYLLLCLAVGILAASTTERGAIMIALCTIAFLVLYINGIANRRLKISLTIFSMILMGYVFWWLKFVYVQHAATASQSSFLKDTLLFFEQIKSPIYAAQVQEFLVTNILLFGIFSIFNWRLALIAFAAMLPNLFLTVGGAEKNGWATHYHSMYFPFLVFAAAIGFSKLWMSLGTSKYRAILIGILFVLIPVISKYSPGYGREKGAIIRLYEFYSRGESNNYDKTLASQLKQIAAAIPAGSKVTTPEGFVPILYRDRTIFYYPIGIDTADYAVLSRISHSDGSFHYGGTVSFIAGESEKIDICLTQRLRTAGYDVDQPKLVIGTTVVLKRIHQ